MQKGVCKCVFLGRTMKFFGPSLGGGDRPPRPRPHGSAAGSETSKRISVARAAMITGKGYRTLVTVQMMMMVVIIDIFNDFVAPLQDSTGGPSR